jgi:hypothetical protein
LIKKETEEVLAELVKIHNSNKNELREPKTVFQKIFGLLEDYDELSPNIQKRL